MTISRGFVFVAGLLLLLTACQRASDSAIASETTTDSAGAAERAHLAPGDHVVELRHGRRDRSYIVHVPPALLSPAPVVIALHGGGGTGAQFQEENGLDEVADREGFIAVYPEGTGVLPNRLHTWNSGDNCCGFALDRDVDDVGFLRAVITSLEVRADVDPDRIYLTGHSNGAMMAYRFAAEASELVAAIAPIGGAIDLAEPFPSEAVALLHIHSLDDPRALYDGGEGPPFPGTDRTVHHEPVLAGIEGWARANGCSSEPTVVERIEGTGDDRGQSYERLAWSGCSSGGAVQHLVLSGSGHGWPGVAVAPLWQRHLGPSTTIMHASDQVWDFVSQFD